ncbi:hypothetical protein [Paraburkholderia atlantica]|uniref:hypothetical protein n=1 Tax=Paraburkholderia atlantica TaxID=2654982 RepID=UPI0015903288|nr:hypothetical protein [Paraburkholderia atlantica]MBB5419389.1 hypothetical protein [Paraburkholderia atlantica]
MTERMDLPELKATISAAGGNELVNGHCHATMIGDARTPTSAPTTPPCPKLPRSI